MAKTYIFDVLTHPCINGDYRGRDIECSFSALAESLKQTDVKWCCAVGLEGIGGYEHKSFAAECKRYPNIIPVAAYNPKTCTGKSPEQIKNDLNYIKGLGFKAIKLHPRISEFKVASEEVEQLLAACEEIELPVFLCTYHYGSLETCPLFNTLTSLLNKFTKLKLLLVHAGAVEVLKYMELARAYPNVLLDLSMTLMKYQGSSIDQDLKFLFEKFDRRICIGSDHPEYSLEQLQERFEFFSEGISQEKKNNIAHLNIIKFLGLEGLVVKK